MHVRIIQNAHGCQRSVRILPEILCHNRELTTNLSTPISPT